MKKSSFTVALIVAMFLLLFAGCTHSAEPITPESALAFPGTQWNMTPEQLIKALCLKKGEYQVFEIPYGKSDDASGPEGIYGIHVTDMEVFGKNGQVGFRFLDFTGSGNYGLVYIVVEYPEDTDMKAVKDAMIKAYGEPSPYDSAHNGTDYRKHVTFWNSEVTEYDVLSQKQIQTLPEISLASLQRRPLAHVFWSDETELALIGTQTSNNGLSFYSALNEMLNLKIE